MKRWFKDILLSLLIIAKLAGETLLFLAILLGIPYLVTRTAYSLDRTNCQAFVEGQPVYEGKCWFIDIHSVGENGNTKVLDIHKDIMGFITLDKYVNEDIKIVGAKR